MSAGTKERIAAAIKTLDFHPDRSAQRLKSNKTKLIGCVIGDISSPFSALLLKGITSVCEDAGYQVLFADSQESEKRERRAIQGFLDNRVDGLIVNTCGQDDEYILRLSRQNMPIVLADRPLLEPGLVDTVCISNEAASAMCTRFLFEQGYAHVAFFSESIGRISPRLLRCRGYKTVCAEQGSEHEVFELEKEDLTRSIAALREFRERHPGKRIAALSTNGTTTQHLLVAMKELGIRPGYDFGLCTFDDWTWLNIAEPGITAVSKRTTEIGERAAKLLLRRISGKCGADVPPQTEIVSYDLIVRDSTPGSGQAKHPTSI